MHSMFLLLVASLYVLPGDGAGQTSTLNVHQGSCCEGKCQEYRGEMNVTKTGRTCQRWDVNTPHKVTYTPTKYPDSGLIENYCRNPSGHQTLWCYTTDPSKDHRWEECDTSCSSTATLTEEILKPQTRSEKDSWIKRLIEAVRKLNKQVGEQQKEIESLQKELNETEITRTTDKKILIEMIQKGDIVNKAELEHLLDQKTESLQKELNETEITQTTDRKILIEMIQKGDNVTKAELEHLLDEKTESLQKELNETEITQTTDKKNLIEMIQNGDTVNKAELEHLLDQKIKNGSRNIRTEIKDGDDELKIMIQNQAKALVQQIEAGDSSIQKNVDSINVHLLEKIHIGDESLKKTIEDQYADLVKETKEEDQKMKTELSQMMDSKNDDVKSNLTQIIDSGDEQIKRSLNQNVKKGIKSAESKLTNKINAKAEELSNAMSQQREEIAKMTKDGDDATKTSVLSKIDPVLKRLDECHSKSGWHKHGCAKFRLKKGSWLFVPLRYGCSYRGGSVVTVCWRQEAVGSDSWCWSKIKGSRKRCRGKASACNDEELVC